MPGLTVDTSPLPQAQAQSHHPPPLQTAASAVSQSQSQSQHTQGTQHTQDADEAPTTISSSSASPTHTQTAPPYSPITPTLAAARLAHSNNSNNGMPPAAATPSQAPSQARTHYTHSQPAQSSIPHPPPVVVRFDENPDALALKSAISILQMQARNATRDIQTLQRIKERAVADPEGFRCALGEGRVRAKRDGLFSGEREDSEDDDDEDEGEDEDMGEEGDRDVDMTDRKDLKRRRRRRRRSGENEPSADAWENLPTPQNVVRCPPINWTQYAVVGESLDKLHDDQVARPVEGMPQRVGPDGQYFFGGDGVRRQSDLGVAAPYTPGRDRIEKMGTRKGGKR